MTSITGYQPSAQQEQEIADWFRHYDDLVAAGDLEAMADQALFPLNEVTDDPQGRALVSVTDRERFVAQMREVGVGTGDVDMRSERHPVFLSSALVFVVTDAEFVSDGRTIPMRYGDLLVRTAEGWRFQTMVAGGWSAEL
jgi:hypothetical protein